MHQILKIIKWIEMKKILSLVFALTIIVFANTTARLSAAEETQTHLTIVPLSGSEQHFAITKIGKIIFEDDKMVLYDFENKQLGATPVSEIGKIVFGNDVITGVNEVQVSSLLIFPNPTQESLIVRGLVGEQVVRVFSLQGQLIQSAVSTDGEAQLHVGGLQNGTYLLQAGAQVVKFIKQ